MPRRPRIDVGDTVYHVLNRANGRMPLFANSTDYRAFEKVLLEAHEAFPMRTLAYCLMPNHWHFVLWPRKDGDLSKFMQWLTLTHAQRRHAAHGTTGSGHLYQGRYKSFVVQSDRHYLTVCRYVERNALRAGLVRRAEDWTWGSLSHRTSGSSDMVNILREVPREWPEDWLETVNTPQSEGEQETLRACVRYGRPFGSKTWVASVCSQFGLSTEPGRVGRPRNR